VVIKLDNITTVGVVGAGQMGRGIAQVCALVQAGVELYKVQRLLGRKSPMMTQHYAHHYPESLWDGVEILDRIKPVSHFITVGSGGRGVEAVSG
jgi:3-hydroxyacyl-CoA dehydrogenase